MLADALIENRLPRHELKADAVIDHGEAAARELGRADKPAADILAGLGGGESQSTFDGHTVASDYGGAWVETAYREILSPETRCLTQSERVDPCLQLRQVLGAGVGYAYPFNQFAHVAIALGTNVANESLRRSNSERTPACEIGGRPPPPAGRANAAMAEYEALHGPIGEEK